MGQWLAGLVLPLVDHFVREGCQDSRSRAEARIKHKAYATTIKWIAQSDSVEVCARADLQAARMQLTMEDLLVETRPPVPKHLLGWCHWFVGVLMQMLN